MAKTKHKVKSCEYPFPSEVPWDLGGLRGGGTKQDTKSEIERGGKVQDSLAPSWRVQIKSDVL
jgi:hypothetical protein